MKNGKATKREIAFIREMQAVMKKFGVRVDWITLPPHNEKAAVFCGENIHSVGMIDLGMEQGS